jgi:hypothetical protein
LDQSANAANSLAYDVATKAAGNTGIMSQFGQTAAGQGISALYGKEAIPAVEGTPAVALQTYRAAYRSKNRSYLTTRKSISSSSCCKRNSSSTCNRISISFSN